MAARSAYIDFTGMVWTGCFVPADPRRLRRAVLGFQKLEFYVRGARFSCDLLVPPSQPSAVNAQTYFSASHESRAPMMEGLNASMC